MSIRHPIPRPANEEQRLASLKRCGILDTPPDADFDFLTEMAAQICGTPFSFVTLVDEKRVWIKSAVGMRSGGERPRDDDYCAWTILETEVMQVRDLLLDERTAELSPTKTGKGFRSYSGVNLQTADGHRVGTLCVIDTQPGELTAEQMRLLKRLARQVMALIELRAQQRELHAAIKSLDRLSRDDELTGLPSRRALVDALETEVSRVQRYSGDLSMVLLAVDQFKSISDRLGQPAADAVLRRIAEVLGHNVRCVDVTGRYGAEVFMLVLPRTPMQGAQVLAELLSERIGDLTFNGRPEAITASFGVVALGEFAQDAQAMICAADQALDSAMRNGSGRVVVAGLAPMTALAA